MATLWDLSLERITHRHPAARQLGRRVRSPGSVLLAGGGIPVLPARRTDRPPPGRGDRARARGQSGSDSNIVNTATLTHPLTRPWIDMQARLGAPGSAPWTVAPHSWPGAAGRPPSPSPVGREPSYGRWPFPVPPPGLPGAPRHWLVTAGQC